MDLFGGSGTTLLACEAMNRNAYVMELDANYMKKIIRRYRKATNNPHIYCINRSVNVVDWLNE